MSDSQAILLLAESVLALAKAIREQGPPMVHVTTPEVTVVIPEQGPPTVNVAAPVVTVQPAVVQMAQPPEVRVEAAKVDVPAPVVTIHEADRPPRRLRIVRNRAGEMTGIEEEG